MSSANEQPVEAEVAEEVHISDNAKLSLFHWSSIANAQTAVLMARRCQKLEQDHANLVAGSSAAEEAAAEHGALARSSVVASAMFIEANINELFISASISLEREKRPGFMGHGFPYVGGLLGADRVKLDDTWSLVDRASVLDKYQFVLVLLSKGKMDKGAVPFQPASALIDTRNKLVHYKGEIFEVGSTQKGFGFIQAQLGGSSFLPHPFTSSGNSFYPDQFFGYAGCRWAWRTADAFVQEFHKRLGVDAAYQSKRPSLTLA